MATLLVMIAFLGIARLMIVGSQSATKSKVATSTVSLAQQGIEEVQSKDFDNILVQTTTEYLDQYGNLKDPVSGLAYGSSNPLVRFVRTTTVTALSAVEKEIVVAVNAMISNYGKSKDATVFTTRRMKFGNVPVGGSGGGGGCTGGDGHDDHDDHGDGHCGDDDHHDDDHHDDDHHGDDHHDDDHHDDGHGS